MNESELLFTTVLNCKKNDLYLNKDVILDGKHARFISQALKRRMSGEPIQYILGETEFMGLKIKIKKNTFIPRPETEILVERTIDYCSCFSGNQHILELGTGSGCIAVGLAKNLPDYFNITATDISQDSLAIAEENARLHHLDGRIRFIKSNLFESLFTHRRYCICVCNPPYIPSGTFRFLPREVRHEPIIALDGGKDGLDFYRRIVKELPNYLQVGGYLIMEIGFNQCRGIKEIINASEKFIAKEVVKDYNDFERIVVAKHI